MSKDPELSFFQQLIAFASLAGLGGVVHYLTTLKTGKKFKWPSFFIELICSAFVGVVLGILFLAVGVFVASNPSVFKKLNTPLPLAILYSIGLTADEVPATIPTIFV